MNKIIYINCVSHLSYCTRRRRLSFVLISYDNFLSHKFNFRSDYNILSNEFALNCGVARITIYESLDNSHADPASTLGAHQQA